MQKTTSRAGFFFFLALFTAPGIYLFMLPLSWKSAVIMHLGVTLFGTLYLAAGNTVAETVVFAVIFSLLVGFGVPTCHRACSPKGDNNNAGPSSETSEIQVDLQH